MTRSMFYASGGAYPQQHTVLKSEHDDEVEATGRPYTDTWFAWLADRGLPDDQRSKW